jgi:O-antigen/teichoic acid export membrane protein
MSGDRDRGSSDDGEPEEDPKPEIAAAGDEDFATMDRKHVRGSALLLVGRLVSLGFTVATQIVIIRALSKTDYGVFAYALTLVASGRILLSLGQGKLLSRFMSTYEETRDYPRMFGSMLMAVVTILVTSTLLIGALALFAEPLLGSSFGGPDAVSILLVLMFLAPMEALDQVFVSLFAVFSKPRAIFFRKYLLTPGLRLAVVLVLVLFGGGVFVLAAGYVVTGLLGLVIYMALLIRVLREQGILRHLRPRRLIWPWREVISFSIPTMTNEIVILVTHMGTVVLLAFFWNAAEVAEYRAVFPAARLNQVVYQTFVILFLPMAARLYAREQYANLRDAYWRSAVFVAVFTFPVFAMTGVFATTTTVTLFGERYASSGAVLMVLSIGYYINMALGYNVYVLQVCGRLRYLVLSNVSAAAVNVPLAFWLIPEYGALGAAFATAATMIGQNIANQIVLALTLRAHGVTRAGYLRPYLIVVAAVGVLAVVQLTFQPGIVAAVGVAAVTSVLVLRLSRRWLHLAETFPEVLKVPLLNRLVR